MTTVGLVLGAGGSPASAFHAGVLATLAAETGWDARTADLIVGTSAGANTAVTLRAGLSAADHLARLRGEPLSDEGSELVARVRTALTRADPGESGWRAPASPRLVLSGLLRRDTRPGVVLAGVLPRGRHDGSDLASRAREIHPDPWPTEPTWIVAVRLDNGARVVFGRDDVTLPHIADAVQASSAVPGLYAPVTLDGVDHVDGGVHSPTNADLTVGLGYDVVVVSSPMSARDPSLLGDGATRWWHHRLAEREATAARVGATRVLLVEPDDGALEAVDRGHGPDIAAAAARRTAEVLADPSNTRAADRLAR